MYESKVESHHKEKDEKSGAKSFKFSSPGHPNVPDRVVLEKITNKRHIAIVAKYFRFVEYKRPGAEPRFLQKEEIRKLREHGYRVDVIDRK